MSDLFNAVKTTNQEIMKDVYLLSGFISEKSEHSLIEDLQAIIAAAPLRQMMTKMGFSMSAAMTNCGDLGWVSDRKGYRYDANNPVTMQPWPKMPASFFQLATYAAAECGFANFTPDACLINQYKIGASMGLHQDKDEQDFSQPIVSVSLGIPATFAFGGINRADKTVKIELQHGDVIVWGRSARLFHHAIMPLKHPNKNAIKHALFTNDKLGEYRYNLTFRKAG